jgi:hypothetical protein
MEGFTIGALYRPCIVKGKNALFHRWSERAEIIEPAIAVGGHSGGVMKWTVGIVEFEDGRVSEALPRDIVFIDHPHENYIFTEREDTK